MSFLRMTQEERQVKQLLLQLLKNKGHQKFAKLLEYFSVQLLPNSSSSVAYTVFDEQAIYINKGFIKNDPPLAPKGQREIFNQLDMIVRHEICHNILRHQVRMIKQYADSIPEVHLSTSQSLHEVQNILADFEISNLAYSAEDKKLCKNLFLNNEIVQGLVTEIDWNLDLKNASYEELDSIFRKKADSAKKEFVNIRCKYGAPQWRFPVPVLQDAGIATEWYNQTVWIDAAKICTRNGCSRVDSPILDMLLYCVTDQQGIAEIEWQYAEIRDYFVALNNWMVKNKSKCDLVLISDSLVIESNFVDTSSTVGGITLDFDAHIESGNDTEQAAAFVNGNLYLHNVLVKDRFFDSTPAITVYTPEEKSLANFYLAFLITLVKSDFSYQEAILSSQLVVDIWEKQGLSKYFLSVCPFGNLSSLLKNGNSNEQQNGNSNSNERSGVHKKEEDGKLPREVQNRQAQLERLRDIYKDLINNTIDQSKKQIYEKKLEDIEVCLNMQ